MFIAKRRVITNRQLAITQGCLAMLVAATSLELVEQALARLKAGRARG